MKVEMKYKIDNSDKKTPFKVPDGYFENLPLNIQTRISQDSRSRLAWSIPKWGIAIASSIVLVITFMLIVPDSSNDTDQLLAEFSQDELIAYLETMELDEYDITSAFENSQEVFDFENSTVLDGIDLEGETIENVFSEFDLEDEYL